MDISIVYKTFYERQAFLKAYELLSAIIALRGHDAPWKTSDIMDEPKVKYILRDIDNWCNWIVSMDGGL